MRCRTLAHTMVLTTAVSAVVACSAGQETTPPPSSSTPAVSSASSPSFTDTRVQREFCSDLSTFSAAAGPAFTLAVSSLDNGETPKERANVTSYADVMARVGVRLTAKVPPTVADNVRTVVSAATEAKANLAKGMPTTDAIAPLERDETRTARDAVTAYQGPC